MLSWLLLLAATVVAVNTGPAAESNVLYDMDTLRHRPGTVGEEKTPIGSVELTPGVFGQACLFRFGTNARSGFFTAGVRTAPIYDRSPFRSTSNADAWAGLRLADGRGVLRVRTLRWAGSLPDQPCRD